MLLRPQNRSESEHIPAFAFLLHAHDRLQRERKQWDADARAEACCILWKLARNVPIGNEVQPDVKMEEK